MLLEVNMDKMLMARMARPMLKVQVKACEKTYLVFFPFVVSRWWTTDIQTKKRTHFPQFIEAVKQGQSEIESSVDLKSSKSDSKIFFGQ